MIGIKNGVELYSPVAETEQEKRQLEINKERFMNTLVELLLKHASDVKIEK